MKTQQILDRLESVRKNGDCSWMAKCPAHDDKSASLSIRSVKGKTLINCFAGCGGADVMAAMGLGLSDLYEDQDMPQKPETPEQKRLRDTIRHFKQDIKRCGEIVRDQLDGYSDMLTDADLRRLRAAYRRACEVERLL